MAGVRDEFQSGSAPEFDVDLVATVLVIGGGPAGAWAAWSAAAEGATVVLVDKGYCGTSGCAAASGNGVWYVPPDPEARETAMASREALGGFLADREWMERVLDLTYHQVNRLGEWGYPFPSDSAGQVRRSLQGPEYMRLMRRRLQKFGVTILDHAPAQELLVDARGTVGGAIGVLRRSGTSWRVRSGAVVMATGGCAFLSKALGCNVLTGDGYLLGAEVGAELSGMEFSNAYGISPAFSSVTKTAFYHWATFCYEDGTPIPGAGSARGRSVIARTLLEQPVYAILDQAPPEIRGWMRAAQPNFFLPLDRARIDPFTQRFPVTLRLEGTVRGTGGLRLVDTTCATTVPGLYAAGDAATRELVCGGFTGGGSHNAAWAIASGSWSGQGAARFARRVGTSGPVRRAAPPAGAPTPARVEEVIEAVQAEVFPYQKNYFRSMEVLQSSLQRLDRLWQEVGGAQAGGVRWREAQAMVATARWMYASALARRESRGMHRLQEYPQQDPGQQYRLRSGGLEQVWVKPEAPVPLEVAR